MKELVSLGKGEVRDFGGFSVTFPVPIKILRKGILEEVKEGGKCG